MPLPVPRKGESQNDYVSRCISFEKHASPNREDKQVQAMCFERWREFKGGAKLAFFDEDTEYKPAGVKTWRKQILAFGVWRHPDNRNVEFEITKDVALQIIKNFKAGIPVEAPVVLTHTDDPKARVGVVKEFIMTTQGLDAILSVDDDAMNLSIASKDKAPGVSCWLDLEYLDKHTNDNRGAVVKHVALVNHPYMEGLSGWQTVSMSDVSEAEEKDEFTIMKLSEKKTILLEANKMPKTNKEELIKALKDEHGVDVTALLSDSEEYKTLSDRIDKGELIAKEDAATPLSAATVTKIKEALKLGEDVTKVEDVVTALLDKFVSLSGSTDGTQKELAEVKKQLSEMAAEKAVGVLLSGGFALPTEKAYLTKLYLSDKVLFDEVAETRKKAGALIKLGEDGVPMSDVEKKEEEKDKALDAEVDRQVAAAKDEGLIPKG